MEKTRHHHVRGVLGSYYYEKGLVHAETLINGWLNTFPCRMILGGITFMSTTVDGSATLTPPSTIKSRPCNEFEHAIYGL